MSPFRIVPSKIIVDVTVPVSPVVTAVPVTAGNVIVVVPAAAVATTVVFPDVEPANLTPVPPNVGNVANTLAPVPVTAAYAVYSASQSAAVVAPVLIQVKSIVKPGVIVAIKLPPDELTVKFPVETFSIV